MCLDERPGVREREHDEYVQQQGEGVSNLHQVLHQHVLADVHQAGDDHGQGGREDRDRKAGLQLLRAAVLRVVLEVEVGKVEDEPHQREDLQEELVGVEVSTRLSGVATRRLRLVAELNLGKKVPTGADDVLDRVLDRVPEVAAERLERGLDRGALLDLLLLDGGAVLFAKFLLARRLLVPFPVTLQLVHARLAVVLPGPHDLPSRELGDAVEEVIVALAEEVFQALDERFGFDTRRRRLGGARRLSPRPGLRL